MSQKIVDVINVLRRIRQGYGSGNKRMIKTLRILAVEEFARERGVTDETVADSFIRRLKPDVVGTKAFDHVIYEWLEKEDDKLKQALLNQALDLDDTKMIKSFF
ncbi:MAG TPA: hypothetical protein VIJ92_00580 [Ginsengibacter sp.]